MDRFNAEKEDYRTSSVHSLISLKDRIAVVTGGARGLGLGMAVACAELGARVAIVDVLEEPTENLKVIEDEQKLKLHYFRADITSKDAVTAVFSEISSKLGVVDCLVNAAGVGTGGPFVDCNEETMQKILNVNLMGTMLCTQTVCSKLLEIKRSGAIVNISSIGGHAGIPGQLNAVYCATKGAILAFTKSLATEYSQKGIRVNSVSPGFFLTKITPGYMDGNVPLLQDFENRVPMGRFADRYELKSIVAFLLTDASSYITGEDIAVDGGVLAA